MHAGVRRCYAQAAAGDTHSTLAMPSSHLKQEQEMLTTGHPQLALTTTTRLMPVRRHIGRGLCTPPTHTPSSARPSGAPMMIVLFITLFILFCIFVSCQ